MRSAFVALGFLALAACTTDVTVDGVDPDADDGDEDIFLSDPDLPDRNLFAAGATVGDVARTACSTAGVKPLATQLLAEVNCLRPDTLTSIGTMPGVSLGAGALPELNVGAARALRTATNGASISISSSTRATAQQYVLYYWYSHGRCTSVVSLAAQPGRSNHESGVALDVPAYSTWRSRLTAQGFRWLGSSDVVHFDYTGAGAVDIRPLAVKAFQRLWNRNNPGDRIAEDGAWGPSTASRMDRAPAGGFAIGPSCGAPSTPTPTPGATVSLTGVIYEGTDTSARIAGATITVGTRTTTSSATGVYTLTGLPVGAVRITATKAGYTSATIDRMLATGVDNWGSVSLRRTGSSRLAAGPRVTDPSASVLDDCAGVTAVGTCDGAVVSHCAGGRLVQVDCAASGQSCGLDDDGLADCQ